MNQETFNDMMEKLSDEYYELLQEKDAVESKIDQKRIAMENILRAANRDEYDNPHAPVVITYKLKKTPERMVKGCKDILRNILTPMQWRTVYQEPGEKQSLVVKRRKSE